jgi:hypothetical protein
MAMPGHGWQAGGRESRPARPGCRYETMPGGAWNGSWNGAAGILALPVLSVRLSVLSMQLMRPVDEAVVMVRRRSTVRFRNGAPGHGQFSNDPTSCMERALETLLSSHSSESSHGTAGTRAAGAEGGRRRAVRPGAFTLMSLMVSGENDDQRIASLLRGAAPKAVLATPQSMKPAAL